VEIAISSLGEHLVRVALEGRLDTHGVDRVETRFVAAIVPGGHNAIVDMTGVEFVSSMGIRMFVATARTLKARQLKLALYGVSPQVGQVFEAVALQKIIPICSTEEDALTAVAP
jgi:anti-anti-sigma factor